MFVAAGELGRAVFIDQGNELAYIVASAALGLLVSSSAITLFAHMGLELFGVHDDVALCSNFLGDLEREPERVMELEGSGAGEFLSGFEPIEFGIEHDRTLFEGLAETFFFSHDDAGHQLMVLDDFRIVAAHDGDNFVDEVGGDEVIYTKHVGMADGTTHDATQHITPAFVVGEDTIADQEGHGPAVLSQNAGRHVAGLVLAVDQAGQIAGLVDQTFHFVDLKNRVDTLQQGENTFEASSGIDAWCGKKDLLATFLGVILHEHQVPEL